MTTKLILKNDACSNGDVHIDVSLGQSADPTRTLLPGHDIELWVSTEHKVAIHESWPSQHSASTIVKHGAHADSLIAAEVAIQDKMWGDANERADAMKGQMLRAALAQGLAIAVVADQPYLKREIAFDRAKEELYPRDWSGFRDYGSDIANLAVMGAYVRNEIKRRLAKGEGIHRAPRTTPYTSDQPQVSSADANREPVLTINERAHGHE